MYDRRALMATPHGLPCSPQPTAPAHQRLPTARSPLIELHLSG